MNYALGAAVLIGVCAAAFLVARSPTFWIGLGKALFIQTLPLILKRMPADKEQEWRDLQARGASKEEINQWEADRLRNRNKK